MVSPKNILQIVSFLDLLSIGLLISQLKNHAMQLGCSQILIGSMGTLYSGFQLISEPMIGSLSDIKGRKPILFSSIILCAFGYLLTGITTSITIFVLIRCFLGMVKQTQLLTKALAPDYEKEPHKQAIILGRMATLSGISFAIGPIISGHVMEALPENGFTILCVIVSIIFVFNAGLIRSLPDPRSKHETKKINITNQVDVPPKLLDSVKDSVRQSMEQFTKVDWSVYWDVFLFKLLLALTIRTYFSNYAVFLKTKHDAPSSLLGYIISFQSVVGGLSTYFIGPINKLYVNDKDFSMRTKHIFLILTVSLVGMALSPNLLIYLFFVIPFSLSSSVSRIVSLEMIVSKGENECRGAVMGATGTVGSLAGVVTPLLAGFVAQYLGISFTLYFAAFYTSIGIVASYKLRSQNSIIRSKKES